MRSTGNLQKLDNGFDANFDVDVPDLTSRKWKITVSRRSEPKKMRRFLISAESQETQEIVR